MTGAWRKLGPAHQCGPTAALGGRHAHEVIDATEFWCPECQRLWVKTSHHLRVGARSLCGCGWRLEGVFTNAEALERFYERLRASYGELGGADTALTLETVAEMIRQDREGH